MPEGNLLFGGGASATVMTPVVLAMTFLAAILVLSVSRKYILAPFLMVAFLMPVGQQLFVGGVHLYVIRIIVLAGVIRLLAVKLFTPKPLIAGGINGFDKLFILWAFVRGLAFILLLRQSGALVNQVGLWLDAFGGFFIFRYAMQDEEDIFRTTKVLASVMAVLGTCMLYEFLTRVNVFAYIAGHPIVPWLRNGMVRAQGVFANSITAGSFGATLLPLFFWLWKSGKARLWGFVGLVSASLVALTSMASTPITAFLGSVLALGLWSIRKHMKLVRWGLALGFVALSVAMNAPVWFIITKINVAGGDSWDRANLFTQAVKHFPDWWLLGTIDNANWGDFTWDQCNQYISEGFQGGIFTQILFIALISRGFAKLGQCRKRTEGQQQEWFFWCMGSALFAHCVAFLGIDYFDQTRTLWVIFLALISSATYPILGGKVLAEPQTDGDLVNSQLAPAFPSPDKQASDVFLYKSAQPFKPRSSYAGKLNK